MNEMIELIPVKYNECITKPLGTTITDMGEVVLNGPDSAVLLLIEVNNDTSLNVLPGNTVFAGGPQNITLCEGDTNYIYLECGPYLNHNSDGTDSIKFEVEYGSCAIVVLQLN